MFYKAVVLCFLTTSFQPFAHGCIKSLLDSNPFIQFQAAVAEATSSGKIRQEARVALRGLDRQSGPGMAVLDTKEFFPVQTMRQVFHRFPVSTIMIDSGNIDWTSSGAVLANDGSRPFLNSQELAPFHQYLTWLTELLNQELPYDEQVAIKYAELRVSNPGNRIVFPDWHHDGEYLAAAVSLLGSGTEYLLDSPKVNSQIFETLLASQLKNRTDFARTPVGKTLIFSCSHRWEQQQVAATAHRSPNVIEDRMLLIVRYQLVSR